jgi:hypothetical protein
MAARVGVNAAAGRCDGVLGRLVAVEWWLSERRYLGDGRLEMGRCRARLASKLPSP